METERDEQEFEITNKIMTIGIIVVVAVCIILLITNIVISFLNGTDRVIFNYDYLAIMFLYLSIMCFYSFNRFKNVYHLITGIGFCLTFICMLAMHFINLIG